MSATFDVRVGNIDDPKEDGAHQGALAPVQGRQDRPPAADRPGRQRPARQAGRGRADRRGHREEQGPRDLRALLRRGARLRPPENRIDFNARAEAFLAENLGGRCEPISGEKVPGSTAVVREVGRK